MSAQKASFSNPPVKVGFVFSSVPHPILLDRMRALEEAGDFETHAIYWHRSQSDLNFPFSTNPLRADRFTPVDVPDLGDDALLRACFTLSLALKIRRWIRQNRFDILHVVQLNMLIATYIASLGKRIPLVYDVWDASRSETLSFYRRAAYRILLSKTPQIFTTSQAFIDHFLVPNRILRDRIHVIEVSNAPLSPTPETKQRSHDHLVIGCIGNLRVPQQLKMLVESVRQVRQTGRDIRIRLSGAGSQKRLATELSDSCDYVEYTGPYNYYRDSAKLYGRLDVVYAVYPLENYNYRIHVARRLHDAVQSSTPLIVSRDSYMANLVASKGIGWTVGHESPGDLINTMTKVFDDRSLLVECIRRMARCRSEHCFEAYREQYLLCYRNVIDASNSR